MKLQLRPFLISLSVIFFLPALYFFRVIFARADSLEETVVRNYSLGAGFSLLVLSVGLGVWSIFLEFPSDRARMNQGKRLGCLTVALVIIGFVAAEILVRIANTDH